MKVEYTLTPKDYFASMTMTERVQNSPAKPRWGQVVKEVALFLLVLGQFAMILAQFLPWPVVAGVSLLVAVFSVLFFFLVPLILNLVLAGALRRARFPAMSRSLEVRSEGLATTMGTIASLTVWESIDRIVVSDTHAFFYDNNMGAHILPRRVFADERDFEEFVGSARQYQEAAKRRSAAKQL